MLNKTKNRIYATVLLAMLGNYSFADSIQIQPTKQRLIRTAVTVNSNTMTNSVTKLSPTDWYSVWHSEISGLNVSDQEKLKEIAYYVRVSSVDISKVYSGATTNPDNVKRIERLMPKAYFERTFPLSISMLNEKGFIPAEVYSYNNFLKAAAVVPGYCGDFSSYPAVGKTLQMNNPDELCKRMLATTFAHATQETADVDSRTVTDATIYNKIKRTFASVAEADATPANRGTIGRYPDAGGPFSATGSQANLTANNYYYGRGVKQLSYPTNYANLSLMLYSNLNLVENPDLVQGNNFLPYLSALVYSLQPKNGNPSIAEIMDGSYLARAAGTARNYAAMGFPFTVAIVNGGPECGTNTANVANTQTRLRAFRYYAKRGNLFPQGFSLTNAELSAEQCNDINYKDPSIVEAGKRPYYFEPTQNCKLVSYDTSYPIFGGKKLAKLAGCVAAKYNLTVVISGAGVNLKSSDGFDQWTGAGTLKYPTATVSVKQFEDKSVSLSFKPSWVSDPKLEGKMYHCPAFTFNKNTTLHITASSNNAAANTCTVTQ
ncbi:MAG: chitinase [Burkholderiales bacterium]|nr:chitinase [Burkholderiales bacterium]